VVNSIKTNSYELSWNGHQGIHAPPFTCSDCPAMKRASWLHRIRTMAAISPDSAPDQRHAAGEYVAFAQSGNAYR
jgi:hypothetical protein